MSFTMLPSNPFWRREIQFWIFQLIGWSLWISLLVLRDLTFIPREYILERVLVFLVDASIGILLTTALRYLYRAVWDFPMIIRLVAVVFGCWVASQAWRPIKWPCPEPRRWPHWLPADLYAPCRDHEDGHPPANSNQHP